MVSRLKIVIALIVLLNGGVAAAIFYMERERDSLKARLVAANEGVALQQAERQRLMALALESLKVVHRAQAAWYEQGAGDQERIEAFLEMLGWLASIAELKEPIPPRAELLDRDRFFDYLKRFSHAQDKYATEMADVESRDQQYIEGKQKLEPQVEKAERVVTLLKSTFHILTILVLILTLFNPEPQDIKIEK